MEKIDLRSVVDQERNIIRRDAIKMIKRILLNFMVYISIQLGIGGSCTKNQEHNY